MRVVSISSSDTHPLRLLVLRGNDPARSVTFPEDDDPGAFHLGVLDESGTVVATSTWIPRPTEHAPGVWSIQLRGMATAPALQGTGLGGTLLEAGVARCRDLGFEVLWARARDSALAFYTRHGCEVVGDGFVDDTTRLPHHFVIRSLVTAPT